MTLPGQLDEIVVPRPIPEHPKSPPRSLDFEERLLAQLNRIELKLDIVHQQQHQQQQPQTNHHGTKDFGGTLRGASPREPEANFNGSFARHQGSFRQTEASAIEIATAGVDPASSQAEVAKTVKWHASDVVPDVVGVDPTSSKTTLELRKQDSRSTIASTHTKVAQIANRLSDMWTKRTSGSAATPTMSANKSDDQPMTMLASRRDSITFGVNDEDNNKYAARFGDVMVKWGLTSTVAKVKEALEDPEALPGWNLVHGTAFHLVCSAAIVINALFIGWSANSTLEARMYGDESPTSVITAGEVIFAAFFTLELVSRLVVEKWLFLFGPECKWNAFDSLLVILGYLDLAISSSDAMASNLTYARMVRLVRFFRLARLTRVIRHAGNLRLVLFAILDSMSSLFGCFVIIALTLYVFAVFFMTAASEYFVDTREADDEIAQSLRDYFGGFYRTMVTLFMVITNGIDWRDAATPLETVNSMYLPILIFYLFLMHFGVLNVVVGTFAATASEIAKKDRDALVKYELHHWETYTRRIKQFFLAADSDKSGTLSWEEFRTYITKDRKIKAYFQTMDLDVSQAHVLFDLLDKDGTDEISVDDFLEGCLRLKGQAKSLDVNMLILLNQRLQEELMHFTKNVNDKLCFLADEVDRRVEKNPREMQPASTGASQHSHSRREGASPMLSNSTAHLQ